MSRQMQIIGTFGIVFSLALGIGEASAQCPTPPSGHDCKCNGDDSRWVCADWSKGAAPIEDVDFIVTYTGNIPAVKFATGDLGWELYSEKLDVNGDPDGPAHLGAITLHPTVDTDDFTLKIAKGTGVGAVNVGSMVLDGSANANWTGFSSIVGFSRISGDLGGLTLVKDSSGNGGKLSFLLVSGDLTAALTVPIVTGAPSSFGNVIGAADVTIGKVDASSISFVGSLVCVDAVCPDITVTDKIFDGTLTVSGDVPSGSTVEIQELEEADPATGTTVAMMSPSGDFAGTLYLPNGLANPHTGIQLGGNFVGVADLGSGVVALHAEIAVYQSTTDAVIKNVGAVSGDVYLGQNIPGQDYKFEGTATFASVTSTGEIGTTSLGGVAANFPGVINVSGPMAGIIEIAGSMLLDSEINITGSMTGAATSGNIVIEDDCAGDIDVGQSVSGDICIGGDLTGSVIIGDALANRAFTGAGRILVAGESSGAIKVGEKTGSMSLIQVAEGLATGATIQVNSTRGAFDAEGDIHIGGTTPTALPFDGCIRIFDDDHGNNGDLIGDIDVIMCHDDQEDLNICIDGSDNGSVNLDETGCDPANATWSCNTCPPTP